MMKRIYIGSTIVFWIAVTAIWTGSLLAPPGQRAVAQSPEPGYTPQEVAAHASAEDCWMAIGAEVYDLTAYLPHHPTPPGVIVPSCGTDATVAYNTKNRGRPHSPYAASLLEKYRIGRLEQPPTP
jgi:cytochrome b involved in lipid metabolism